MIQVLRVLTHVLEMVLRLPLRAIGFLTDWVAFNPRLGPVRHVATAAICYVLFAALLVYVFAPLRGVVGQTYLSEKLRYDAERWLATAIYDTTGSFAGTYDPRLDSRRDVNFTDRAIDLGGYQAFPDHKSIPVREVPEHYWKCLVYHEDRHLGGMLNPYGIDLFGVLKIPVSTVQRSIRLKRLSFGIGGSTLPMQFARVIYKTPPHSGEGAFDKLKRKAAEWWLAPVIYHELTRGGDTTALKQWAANHLWLAQRTGGTPLHGIEVTSRIVFGKQARDLTIAEQFVLASAVNRPIILLEGSDRLNEVRLDRWRYISEVRAKACAENVLDDDKQQAETLFELVTLAGGPPNPHFKPKLQQALETYSPRLAERAKANPIIRANALMPAARFGIREEMKQDWGFEWRNYVRGVTTTLDVADNLAWSEKVQARLEDLDKDFSKRIRGPYTLSRSKAAQDSALKRPQVIVVASDHNGHIVRYFESDQTASYFGSMPARNRATGFYERNRESRMVASTGKILAAIGIANQGRDSTATTYLDTQAPSSGLETCAKHGTQRRGRKAIVAFACSLNGPLVHRTAKVGQARMKAIIDAFGFNMPPGDGNGNGTPPSTAAVLGQVAGSPRRVHHMANVVLARLLGRGKSALPPPSLVAAYDYTSPIFADQAPQEIGSVTPDRVIKRRGTPLLKALLQAPLCYQASGRSHGTLKSLSKWCASRRGDMRFHFAKTGTQVTEDPNATVDVWITGGLQFSSGAAYSYVVLVGTGSHSQPWADRLHSSQVAAPLLEVLLEDLKGHARQNPQPKLLPKPKAQPIAALTSGDGKTSGSASGVIRKSRSGSLTAADYQLRQLRNEF
jgi:penicillin-binding protein 1A